jgi:ATP-dependent helicase/DNAse subunit B
MDGMALTLISGPANAGKVALLLERYRLALEREPVLIVPNRSDVDRVERDLLTHTRALLGGQIGTFDDLFGRVSATDDDRRPVATDVQRALAARRALAGGRLDGWARSARFTGFVDALVAIVGELEAALVEPDELEGELAELYRAYRLELDRLGLWDRDLARRHAAERVAADLGAWDGRPVFAYGFEDLTGTQWALLQALAGRADVTVSLPYEPGRAAFASLERTASDLAALAEPRLEQLPAADGSWGQAPALAYLERTLFEATAPRPQAPALDGALRFLEGAGARGTLELVARELLDLVRTGTPPEQIAVVCPALERIRAPLETALAAAGVPYALAARSRLDQTPFGRALLGLLRFAWLGGGRHDLYRFLRSPYSGLARTHVDYLEGRLRGRGVRAPERVEEETIRLRDGHPLPPLELVRAETSPLEAARELTRFMLRAAYGLEAPPVGEASLRDLRAYEAARRLLDELEGWERLAGPLSREEVLSALERAPVRGDSRNEPGRVQVLDLWHARTGRYEVVFVLGLEEGSLPQREPGSPFLDEEARRELDGRLPRARLTKPDHVSRARYLFYTACTRASQRLYLVRQAASDEGSPREPSPFWEEVRALFDPADVRRATERRALSALTWSLEQAPTERERVRSLAALASAEPETARGLARANGWERRLERALAAFARPTRLTHPFVLQELQARASFGVTELEAFADCSSVWLIDRLVDPKTIDNEPDPKLRGSLAHTTLHKFFGGLPKRFGSERIQEVPLDDALALLRECLDEALAGVRLELTELQRQELEQSLWHDLEQFVREEAASPLTLVPRRFEVAFGSERSAPELQRGLAVDGFSLSGKIDRIDLDPFSARGIVQDYKSGRTAHSAAKIDSELRLQIPLYMLVLRDLVGIEPLGGLYRALAGERRARGLLRAEAKDDLPGFVKSDYLDEEAFWAQVERATEHARRFVERIRAGDVRHDPKTGDCPTWCELWPMCRVRRA